MVTTEAAGVRETPRANHDDDYIETLPTQSAEEQLARIIAAARTVSVVAEELLREVSVQGHPPRAPHALAMAPRLLAATEQQLISVAAMLRQS
jgi:hypothetical protein